MVIYGMRASKIGRLEIPNTICEQCENQEIQDITVFGRYFHVFWIPMFPVGRTVVGECDGCMKTSKKRKFTPQLKRAYEQHKRKAKRPIWHWTGSIILGLLIALITIVGGNGVSDPRADLLQADLNAMVSNPTQESDSVSYAIKEIMDITIVDELQPHKFKYLTKTDSNKAIILMKIPKLRKVKKEDRLELLEMIEMVVETTPDLAEKDIYIGVEGRISVMLLKTPTELKNGRFIIESPLYEYYGPKSIEKEENETED